MSGIVGSKLNIRGSGLVGSLGTDGQHMLSAGAGKTNVFETVAAGGGSWTKIKQIVASTASSAEFVDGASDVVLDSTYEVYVVVYSGVYGSVQHQCHVHLSTDTGSSWETSGYMGTGIHVQYANDAPVSPMLAGWENHLLWLHQHGNAITKEGYGIIYFFGMSDTASYTKAYTDSMAASDGTIYISRNVGHGINTTIGSHDGIKIYPNAGTFTGTFTLYGITH